MCCSKIVGKTLGQHVSRRVLSEVAEVPVPLLSAEAFVQGLKGDIIATLALQHKPGVRDAPDDLTPVKKARRNPASCREMMAAKTKQCLWVLENRLAVRRAGDTLLRAKELIQDLEGAERSEPVQNDLTAVLVSRPQLTRHLLLLDGAVDRRTSELLFQSREQGTWAGVAVATDESPPKQPRFRGLRFQITVMYLGVFNPQGTWETSTSPPLSRTSMLADIMHCAGKKGKDVSQVLERQLSRVGLNSYDVVAGTGDGGGENEGSSGIHSHFENLSPGYVRHRCLPHIAWRTGDMALRSSGLEYKALCAYLVDGITWSRLRDIAVSPREQGGLALFTNGSRRCKDIFGTAPGSIITTRPETDLQFLKLLRGKEHVLHQLASKDLEQRTKLGAETVAAVASLGDITQRIRRTIICEILERCFFLAHWSGKHQMIAMQDSWTDLVNRATGLLLSLSVSPEFLQRFGTTWTEFERLNPRPKTWVEFAVLRMVGDEDLVDQHLPESLDFHRRVTDSAASHLALLGDNTYRTPWVAAKLLSSDQGLARAAAQDLAKHLASTKPCNRTLFEAHIFDSEALWKDLVAFSNEDPPLLLWRGHGKFQALFRFLAPRFLLAPDHVLDAERVHARWQWLCLQKRAIKLHALNSSLRLTHYLENNYFPDQEDLYEHLQAEALEHKVALETLTADGEIATGWRSEFLYRDRLGLSPNDAGLIADDPRGPVAPAAMTGTPFAQAWRNYVKSVLVKGFMYRVSINPGTLIYVSENKTLAGKEHGALAGEATGRKLVVTFFEECEDGLAHRVDRDGCTLKPQLLTLAEILQILGFALPPDPDRSSATTEHLVELHYQNLQIARLTCTLETAAPEVHVYRLSDMVCAEEAFALDAPADARTKMVLVRSLQRAGALQEDESLEKAWTSTLADLQGRTAALFPAPGAPPPAPRGRGRARGRGRGRVPG